MGKSSEKFIEQRELEHNQIPLPPTPTEFTWKEYFVMLGAQYAYKSKKQ